MASDCFEMKASKKDERYTVAGKLERPTVPFEVVVKVDGKPVKTVKGKTSPNDTFADL